MSNRQKFYINGQWVEPSTSDTLDVINPATEQPIEAVAMGGVADVDKAVAAAKAAFETFSQTTKEERIALLEAVIAKYAERMADIAGVISEEMGAPSALAAAALAAVDAAAESGCRSRLRDSMGGSATPPAAAPARRTPRQPTELAQQSHATADAPAVSAAPPPAFLVPQAQRRAFRTRCPGRNLRGGITFASRPPPPELGSGRFGTKILKKSYKSSFFLVARLLTCFVCGFPKR